MIPGLDFGVLLVGMFLENNIMNEQQKFFKTLRYLLIILFLGILLLFLFTILFNYLL